MKINKIIRHYIFGESIKEIEMNRILDKISKKLKLTKKEVEFINLYNETNKSDDKDFMMISKNLVYKKIKDFLSIKKKVICDLHDRNGKIGLPIIDIKNHIEDDHCIIIMNGGEYHKLHDKFLYNLIYNVKKDEYSLEEHDEYFEKLTIRNGED
jgi:hypothetical protein